MGNHIGPRQLELPPNIPESDSAGRYLTSNRCSRTSKVYGFFKCHFESDRMPKGERKRSSSSMRVRIDRSFFSLHALTRYRPSAPGKSGGWMFIRNVLLRARNSLVRAANAGNFSTEAGEMTVVAQSGSN